MSTRVAQSLVGLVTAIALAAGTAAAQSARPAPQPPLLQMRMASETPQPGFDRLETSTGGEPAYVSRTNVLADEMIRHVRVLRTDDGLVLEVICTEEGKRRLEIATRERMTSHMALLLESGVAAFAPIMATLRSGRLTVGLTLAPDKAEHYLLQITGKWPPRAGPVAISG